MTASNASPGLLRRDRDEGWIGGVAAGIARRFGIDVSLVRLAFVVSAAAGGVGVGAYALGWLLIPAGDADPGRVLRICARPARLSQSNDRPIAFFSDPLWRLLEKHGRA